jgi:hypothetical protein
MLIVLVELSQNRTCLEASELEIHPNIWRQNREFTDKMTWSFLSSLPAQVAIMTYTDHDQQGLHGTWFQHPSAYLSMGLA